MIEIDGIYWLIVLLAAVLALAYFRSALWTWLLAGAVGLGAWITTASPSASVTVLVLSLFLLIFIPISVIPLRRQLFSLPMLHLYRKLMPPISETEAAALEAGTTWWDAELFSGKPDWKVLTSHPAPCLTREEEAFLEGPVEELCRLLNDWKITQENYDLPPKAWEFLKQHGFFGMIIPKRYGGLEFSALAHSEVIMKLASKSITAAVTAMVPNSLGPGQLLINYGTQEQKDFYLPRLARGEEIPCFALTSPRAGSDAASMTDTGIICKGEFEGKKDVLGIRLNWEKRYITLAPVATVLGLAFKMYDPDHLLGEKEDLGITLALIPTDLPGVETGPRHFPLNLAFQNGSTAGKDVFISLDSIVGGPDYAGKGWRMLMECLAEGRSISLPSLSAGAGKLASRATGAYARIRKQFKLPIGRFEGVQEALARIVGHSYAIEAIRTMTAVSVDQGGKPSVISAMAKYHCTERMRNVINDAMDVFGGTAICLGPSNLMGRIYQSIPIGITVEGANILTRSLIIFGQGIIRCHPHLLAEMRAAQNDDERQALTDFDRAFFAHLSFVISNKVRTLLLAISGGWLAQPHVAGAGRRYARQIERLSAALAFISDTTLFVLGGALKRKELLSARLGDVLSQLYIASAAIKRFEDQGRPKEDIPILAWVCEDAIFTAQQKLDEFMRNFPNRFVAWSMRLLVFPAGKPFRPPSDHLGQKVAMLLLDVSDSRDRLTQGIYINDDPKEPLGRIEHALNKTLAAAEADQKLREAIKSGAVQAESEEALIQAARKAKVITAKEAGLLENASKAVEQAIAVDTFTQKMRSR